MLESMAKMKQKQFVNENNNNSQSTQNSMISVKQCIIDENQC
jgi:hypothetical protein